MERGIGEKRRTGIVNLERRKHPRFNVDLPIEYHRVAPSDPLDGRAVNASEGGLLVYFPEPVEVGEYLKLRIFFAGTTRLETIELLAQVAWTDFHIGQDWGEYRSGVRFVEVPPEALDRFANFLKSLST